MSGHGANNPVMMTEQSYTVKKQTNNPQVRKRQNRHMEIPVTEYPFILAASGLPVKGVTSCTFVCYAFDSLPVSFPY